MKEMLLNLNFYKKIKFFHSIALVAIFSLGASQAIFAQDNVGIGTASPDASAVLDVVSTSKGVLIPRLTTANRDAIVSPKSGLLVYNTDDLKFNYFNGTIWEEVGGGIKWFSGQGNPAAKPDLSKTKLGDLYLDEVTGDIWQREVISFPPSLLDWRRRNSDNKNIKIITITGTSVGSGLYYTPPPFTFPGADLTKAAFCSPSFNLPDGIIISHAWVSDVNKVSVKFYNTTGASISIDGDYQIAIF